MMAGFAVNWRWKFRRNGNTPANGWRLRWTDCARHAGTPSFCAAMIFVCGTRRAKSWRPCPDRGKAASIPKANRPAKATGDYVPLRVHSHYSFLDSTLSPSAIVELAKQHGMSAVAMTDTGNLHGAVEFVLAAKQAGIKPILGAELCVGTSRCCSTSNQRGDTTTFAACCHAMPN